MPCSIGRVLAPFDFGGRPFVEQEAKGKKRLTRTAWFWILIALGTVVVACGLAVLVDSLARPRRTRAEIVDALARRSFGDVP